MSENGEYGTVSFQANQDLRTRLDKQAEKEHADRSTICRKAIDEYCEDSEGE